MAALAGLAQNASAGDAYSRTVTIKREAGDVWAALVTKSIVDTYYFAPVSEDLTEVGQQFYYGTKDQQLISGKVMDLQAPIIFKHSFRFASEEQSKSVVTYSVEPLDSGTRLIVTHEGYEMDTQSYADIAGGWPIILDGMKTKLESN